MRKQLLRSESKSQVRNRAKQMLIIVETYCSNYYESHTDNDFSTNDRKMAIEHLKESLQTMYVNTEKMKSQLEFSINHILTTFTGLGVGDIRSILKK